MLYPILARYRWNSRHGRCDGASLQRVAFSMAWSCALCGADAAGSGAGTFGASKPWLAWTCTAGSCASHSTSENTVLPWMTHLRSTPAGVAGAAFTGGGACAAGRLDVLRQRTAAQFIEAVEQRIALVAHAIQRRHRDRGQRGHDDRHLYQADTELSFIVAAFIGAIHARSPSLVGQLGGTHAAQDHAGALGQVLRVAVLVEEARIGQQYGQLGRLRRAQIGRADVVIVARRRLRAVDAGAEFDDVQINLEDALLVHQRFEHIGDDQFLPLAHIAARA